MSQKWTAGLSWRLGQQLLDPVGDGSVVDVVARLGAVPAWPDATAEIGVGARRRGGRYGDAAAALDANEIVKVYAFRGALHLMTPQAAGAYLAVRASSHMWELKSWVDYYDLKPADWPRFREHVRGALADGPLTRSELLAAIGRSRAHRHLVPLLADGNDTLLKPLSWQGDMGLGAGRDGEATFLALDDVPAWGGIPDLDEAGTAVVAAYLHAYGPATPERVGQWSKGLGARPKDVDRWLHLLAGRIETVSIEGTDALVLNEDLDALLGTRPSTSLHFLPGRDYWVLAPGTSDEHVVPPDHRKAMSSNHNPVVHRGVVAGTWTARKDQLEVTWFPSSGRVPRQALAERAEWLSEFLGRPLTLDVVEP